MSNRKGDMKFQYELSATCLPNFHILVLTIPGLYVLLLPVDCPPAKEEYMENMLSNCKCQQLQL